MTLAWDGVNWDGPSDTGNPKGAPFPEGSYTVTVRGTGQREVSPSTTLPFEVTGTFALRLVP
jgi:hypothetical protein